MSETEKDFIEEYGKQYSRMRNTLVTIIIAIITICIGQWFFSSREQRKVNKDTDEKIASIVKNVEDVSITLKIISKDYAPAWYLTGLTDLYSLSVEKMLIVLSSDKQEEVLRINSDLKRTVEIMQNQFIQMRGGMNNTTRNVKTGSQ
jgi:adenylate kinase